MLASCWRVGDNFSFGGSAIDAKSPETYGAALVPPPVTIVTASPCCSRSMPGGEWFVLPEPGRCGGRAVFASGASMCVCVQAYFVGAIGRPRAPLLIRGLGNVGLLLRGTIFAASCSLSDLRVS